MGVTASRLMQTIHGLDIYAQYRQTLPLDLQGWNSHHHLLRDAIAQLRPSVIIEVGVWKGASTIFLANLLREAQIDGAVIAVDSFLGGYERWNDLPDIFRMNQWQHGRPLLYEQFLSNVVQSKVADLVIPVARTSSVAATMLMRADVRAALIHIDAAHEYEDVMRDCRMYWKLLEPGGWLIGDDYDTSWPGVVSAADQFALEVNQPLTVVAPKFLLRNS